MLLCDEGVPKSFDALQHRRNTDSVVLMNRYIQGQRSRVIKEFSSTINWLSQPSVRLVLVMPTCHTTHHHYLPDCSSNRTRALYME